MSRHTRLALLLVPSGLIVVLVAATPRPTSSNAVPLRVCRHRTADGELSTPLYQRKLEEGYVKIARRFKEALKLASERAKRAAQPYRDPGYRSGLSACRRNTSKSVSLQQPLPPRFRGKTLYFVPVGTSRVRGVLGKHTEVFLTEYRSLREAGLRAKEWGVPVSAAPVALARRLSVRCAGTRVHVSLEGRTLEIREELP